MPIEYRELPPAPDLSLHVRHYWLLKGENNNLQPHAIFPDGAPEIVFNLGDPVLQYDQSLGGPSIQPREMLVGQMMRALWIAPTGRMHMVGVKLAPWGGSAFCETDAVDVRGVTVALGDTSRRSQSLRLDVDAARLASDQELVQQLDALFRARLATGTNRRLRRLTELAEGLTGASIQSVDGWSRSLGCSPRTLERAFDAYVGLPPKVLTRLRRFQRALKLGTESPDLRLAAVAARAGYSDQSHLVREFREFAGAPPGAALALLTEFSSRFLSDEA